MKTITLNVSEPVYRTIQEHGRATDRTASELIREALAQYCEERIRPRMSLRDLAPISLGRVVRPLTPEDDLLAEMNDDARR